jgi:hypothetical protein
MEPLQFIGLILVAAAVAAFYAAFTRAIAIALVGVWMHPW